MSVRRTQTLTGTTTLTPDLGKMHFLDPGGEAREVLLPPMKAGLVLFVKNTADMAEALTLKDVETGLVTVAELGMGDVAVLFTDGSSWGALFPADIDDGEITTAMLAASAVTKAKSATFFSTEQTGTGSAQNVAHGLGAVPAGVLISVTESDGSAFDVAEGTHTSTNVVCTVTSGVKFKVLAWA